MIGNAMVALAQQPDQTDQQTYRRGMALVMLAGVLWSAMGLGLRLMDSANVWQVLFYRACVLVPFLFTILALHSGGRPFALIRKAGIAGVIGGLSLVVAFAGGIFSLQTTTVANATFLFAASPFMAALLGRLILGETVRGATLIAAAVALAGITIMVAGGLSAGYALGNVAALVSALGFASFTVVLRWGKLDDMLPSVFLSGVFTLLIAGAICQVMPYGLAIPVKDIAIAATLGVFLSIGLTIYTIGSKAVPAAELALLSMGEVVLAPFWVWLFLSETPGSSTLVGGAILLAAIAGNAISGLRRKPVPVM